MATARDDNDGSSGLREACGVFACVAAGAWPTHLDIAHVIYLGLVGLQHRGQESAGIVTSDGECFRSHRGMGLVNQVFTEETLQVKLKGNLGVGHTRYSTAGGSEIGNCQPFVVHTAHGLLAVAHNGELINGGALRRQILARGVGLSSSSDSELITQMLAWPPPGGEPDGADWAARITHLMRQTPCAYSLVIMHGSALYAARDPLGNRPLCIGRLPGDDDGDEGWVVSSESCPFQSIGARYVRDVEPGEIVRVCARGVTTAATVARPPAATPALCIFEYVYFARADSLLAGQMVHTVRQRCGRQLALESPADVDVVAAVPESATAAALGFAAACGAPYVEVLTKNRYVGRSFIQPSTRARARAVATKFGALTDNLAGRRVALVDDSIVRGTTIAPIVRLLRDAGAAAVHIRVASPPVRHPCYMGINIPTTHELIANRVESGRLAAHLGADSVAYLSVGGLLAAVSGREDAADGYCTACLTGHYPAKLEW
ncbi:PREDICTED: amidophosphoribosyltransferase-like [Priapulus caudatus]|uniref:Amidophosphoribosyltransferase n=1 Tax=Priapulus caudatus TaxID=37621 RepID=A0ABM1EN21_PRICU|nr:PREDICTED: amidophosphoribosyltransferase-like [Priapulus caudatus]